jgi:hypothetical protein
MKIDSKSFFGTIFDFLGISDTENSNFAKKFDFWTMFTRDTGPQSSKIKCFQFHRFLDKSTLKEYEIELNFNDWVSNF